MIVNVYIHLYLLLICHPHSTIKRRRKDTSATTPWDMAGQAEAAAASASTSSSDEGELSISQLIENHNKQLYDEMHQNIVALTLNLGCPDPMEIIDLTKIFFSFIDRVNTREMIIDSINIEGRLSPPPSRRRYGLNDLFKLKDNAIHVGNYDGFKAATLKIFDIDLRSSMLADVTRYNEDISIVLHRAIRVLKVTPDHLDGVDYNQIAHDFRDIIKRRIVLKRCLMGYLHIVNYITDKRIDQQQQHEQEHQQQQQEEDDLL